MLLQARLEQTEATLQKLIGQMGVLTASLAGAGLVGNSAKEVDVTHEHREEVDSDDEDEEEEDEEEESEDDIEEDNEEDESEDESD